MLHQLVEQPAAVAAQTIKVRHVLLKRTLRCHCVLELYGSLCSAGVAGIKTELAQACFKTLSLLFDSSECEVFAVQSSSAAAATPTAQQQNGRSKASSSSSKPFGLNVKQMRALLVLLKAR